MTIALINQGMRVISLYVSIMFALFTSLRLHVHAQKTILAKNAQKQGFLALFWALFGPLEKKKRKRDNFFRKYFLHFW